MSSGEASVSRAADGLRDARETRRLSVYLREVWARRQYAWYVSSSELRSRQINTVLGNLWHLINPLLQIGVFFIIFGLILDVSRGVDNFIGFLTVGIFVYSFTQKCTIAGAKSMTKYSGLIQIISFPRALLPLTTTISESLAMAPAYVVMFTVALGTGESPKWTWLLVPVMFVVQAVFSLGVSLIASRAAHRVPDVQQVLPFVFRLGFYASGVLFNVNAYLDNKSYRPLFELNPLYCFVEINRSFVLNYGPLNGRLVVIALAWTVLVALAGFIWFRAGEDSYGAQ